MACMLFSAFSWGEADWEGLVRLRGSFSLNRGTEELSAGQSLRLKGSFHPAQNLQARFALFSASSLEKGRNAFRIDGFGDWSMAQGLNLRMGRMSLDLHPSFLDSNSYEPLPHSFFGVLLQYSAKRVTAVLWGMESDPGQGNFWQNKDFLEAENLKKSDLRRGKSRSLGAVVDIQALPEFFKKIQLKIMYLSHGKSAQQGARYGLTAEGLRGGIDYSLTLMGQEKAFTFSPQEGLVDFEAGWSIPQWLDSRIFVGGHSDTKNYDPYFYNRHSSSGLMDMVEWGNLTYLLMGFEVLLPKDIEAEFQFLHFRRSSKGAFHPGFRGALFFKEPFSEGVLGHEADLSLIKSFRSGFEIQFLGGLFFPQKSGSSGSVFSLIEGAALYKF